MKKIIIVSLLLVFGIALFVWVLVQTGFDNIAGTLAQVTLIQLAAYFLLSLINFFLYNLRWWIIIRSHGHNASFVNMFWYRMVAYAISYITPTAQTGGEPVRTYLLSDREDIDIREAASSVIVDKVFEIASLVFFIGCGVVYVLVKGFFPPKMEILLVALVFFFIVLLYLFFRKTLDGTGFFRSIFRVLHLHRFRKLEPLEKKIIHTEEFVAGFFRNSKPTVVPMCIVLSLVTVSFIALEHWILALYLGIELSFSQVFLVSTLPSISYILPVPGGFGLLEGGHTALFSFLGLNAVVAFALVMLIRLRDLFFVGIGMVYLLTHGFGVIRDNSKKIRLGRIID